MKKDPLVLLNFKLLKIIKEKEEEYQKLINHIAKLELKIENMEYAMSNNYSFINKFEHESPF